MRSISSNELPLFVQNMIANPPRSGEGFHNWLFRMAKALHPHRSEIDIYTILASVAITCGRHVSQREILNAIRDSKAYAWQPGTHVLRLNQRQRWPARNDELIGTITFEGIGLADLWELSPWRLEDNDSHTEEIIDLLFPNNPLLCVGRNTSEFNTKRRKEWRGKLADHQLIVPSPMSKVRGVKKDGSGESEHSLDNTGPRCFLIVEFDEGSIDEHACLLYHLAKHAPLVMAVFSGSKSLHGWFFAQGQPEEKLQRFMRYAVQLGADKATWNRSQFVRMPDGLRDNGKRQSVYFFNPEPLRGKK